MKASMKTRKDFLAAARAEKWVGPVMLVQQRDREDANPKVRVGFTASKKVGNAVARNRAKRRLRALSAELLEGSAQPGCDYVWIAKRGTVKAPYWKLRRDGTRALQHLTKACRADKLPAGSTA
ncbi:MAG: ribonuclease P protein component [Alphaproteobacteria bacterium TMED89]|nr:ribonuclease P protein component [Rhodospirillaceae bacterium]RPH11731.1 MAG: ribonuclease P protein component [Alphaproteobacteria bacterium TMED89]